MRKLLSALLAVLALGLVGCPGVSLKGGCKKGEDGKPECSLEWHRHTEK